MFCKDCRKHSQVMRVPTFSAPLLNSTTLCSSKTPITILSPQLRMFDCVNISRNMESSVNDTIPTRMNNHSTMSYNVSIAGYEVQSGFVQRINKTAVTSVTNSSQPLKADNPNSSNIFPVPSEFHYVEQTNATIRKNSLDNTPVAWESASDEITLWKFRSRSLNVDLKQVRIRMS